MEAAKAIRNFSLDEQERQDFEDASTAPLAKEEVDDEECSTTSGIKYFIFILTKFSL